MANALAVRLLKAINEGRSPGNIPEALAAEVLSWPEMVLARAVLAGGEHALDRAIELAGRLVGVVPGKSQAKGIR